MTSGQINYLRDFAHERCKAIDGLAIDRLLDEREALLKAAWFALGFVSDKGAEQAGRERLVAAIALAEAP